MKKNPTENISTDITEHRRTGETLLESEAHFRLLSEIMLQGVVFQDASGTILSMNPAARHILGKSPEHFLGSSSVNEEHLTIRENGESFPGIEHPAMVALRTGLPVNAVIMGVFNPILGENRWISIDAVPVFRPGETRPIEVFTVFEDITTRKNMEDALQKYNTQLQTLVTEKTTRLMEALLLLTSSEHFKQTIIDSLPANIAVIDLNGVITAINRPWLLFGRENDIADETSISVGTDYLASCRTVPACDNPYSESAHSALQGITAVLEGRETSFVMDYPCHSPVGKRWYQMSVMRPEAEFEGAIISHVDISPLKQLEEDRRSYMLHLVEVIEDERLRTARELHDDLGQRLTVLSFAISQLKQNHQGSTQDSQILRDMQTGVGSMMESLRRICTNLRPALLDELGLSAALKWVAKDFTRRSGIPCNVTFDGECCNSHVECAMAIFRIVQESLNNTIKHAGASRTDISFCRINGSVCVQISDDGCGIKPDKHSVNGSFGIIGMRERAHALGATFEIISKKDKGTDVKIVIPCNRQERTDAVSHR